MDGKVFDGNDPAIQSVNLPQGFRCRCRWQSVRKPEDGYFTLSDRLPYSLPDAETISIPAIPVNGMLSPIAEKGFSIALLGKAVWMSVCPSCEA